MNKKFDSQDKDVQNAINKASKAILSGKISKSEIFRHYNGNIEGNIQMISISDIKIPSKWARKHSKKQDAKLKNIYVDGGYTNPVLISEKYELIAGLARIQALKDLGIDTVPAIILYNLTDNEIKALRLADNRIAKDGI